MGLRILDTVSEPGGAKPNEDRNGYNRDAAWVIDGATDVYPEAFLPAVNDVHYLVDSLNDRLARTLDAASDPETALTKASAEVSGDIHELGFPSDRVHPTCSLGVAIDHGKTLEFARIGDATLIAVGAGTTELSTTFYNQREIAAVAAAGPRGLASRDARDALLRRRSEYITGVHPEGVFSGDPSAVLRIHRTHLDWGAVRHVLLCTDGFARAITDYGLYASWRDLIDAALSDSLAAIAKAIREVEHHPEASASNAHFKRSDDLAAVLCEKNPEA
jgi:hypothetical protein